MNVRPRVLVVEDDASLRRFVELALEELPIELVACAAVDAALAELGRQAAALIITDLMMPGRSGFELIEVLNATPALQAGARVVVFSAGLSPAVRKRLASVGVWRLLSKPCPVTELEACVRDALALAPDSGPATPPSAGAEQAVAQQFGGNRALYTVFRASCLAQFAADIQAGDLACAQGDSPALHRLAHSLKSVLLTLGHAEDAALARRLEDTAAPALWGEALPLWHRLRETLAQLN